MSFLDKAEKNVDRLMKEESGGSVAGFTGRAGRGIDALFSGPYHPDSGHGSQNKKLLAKQLKDRRKRRKDLESDRDDVIDDYSGIPDPIGGYFAEFAETEAIELAFDELIAYDQQSREYNEQITPPAETEWKSTGWDYDYDEPGEAYKIRDIKYDDNSGLYKSVVSDIKYDDNSNLYADDTYINKSKTNWKYIK